MAFFGFNKTKVLNAAEKCVQQGKLQNAIAEYEKIAKQDAKDLTVLNTIGDLYARLGNTERAAGYFRKVGDAYATDGFTVKAIAMYKKLTKLAPGTTDCVLKLAELYTQQGLYNDARSQYVQVADQHIKAGELEPAARIFQKMLELDPENAAMQSKLAELYVRLGKKTDARDIYFRAADSLYGRGALDGADEALGRVLALDAGNSRALMLRGKIALDSSNSAKAIEYLEKVPQIDSLPDALASLLRAYLSVGKLEDASPIAHKLLTVHNDLTGINAYADALLASGDCEKALRLYDENAERLFAANPAAVSEWLRAITGRVKDNPAALELLRDLYHKAGDTTQIGEVTELLAHALVQSGELERARDLYKNLSELEPENPIHTQNYRQILARLGQDTLTRPLTEDEGGQPFLADELEFTAPALATEYPPEVADAVRAAITESELFDSYNAPTKAITPLESVLGRAPSDAHVIQRLASLYARVHRFADAARCCTVLEQLYQAAGYAEAAGQYGMIAAKYAQSAGVDKAALAPAGSPSRVADARDGVEEPPPAMAAAAGAEFAVAPAIPDFSAAPAGPACEAPAATVEPAPAVAREFDLSDEWETALVVEPPAPVEAAAEAPQEPAQEESSPAAGIADIVEEARFYLSQRMWDEAAQAIRRAEAAAPTAPEIADLRQQLAAAAAAPQETPRFEVVEEAPARPEPPGQAKVSTLVFDAAALSAAAVPAPAVATPPVPPAAAPADTLRQFTTELDEALGSDFSLGAPPQPAQAQPQAAVPQTEPEPEPSAESGLSDIFAEFKEDVEAGGGKPEDAETHYNLGVAFKEMGLLDEAIGELQKVCHAIDQGEAFAQVMQAYTWLAQCFVEKGVPEAAIRWYEKALRLPGDEETRTALHYELACAYEAAGNRQAALSHFMEVYGTNIDYRDVAERIKPLKS